MSDDLEIRSGGVVAVDTETLRAVAWRLEDLAADVHVAGASIRYAGDVAPMPWHVSDRLSSGVQRAADTARELADSLRSAADVYEIVELGLIQRAADACGDGLTSAQCAGGIQYLLAQQPGVLAHAWWETAWRTLSWPMGLAGQAGAGSAAFGPGGMISAAAVVAGLGWTLAAMGAGKVPGSARLSGPADPLVLRALPSGPATEGPENRRAPGGLAVAAGRIPGGGEARVRVEKYSMPDGSRQFAVYVAGTQSASFSGAEPFDMESNIQLLENTSSASYEAVREALRASGAEEGDVVHAFGHSQGAMIAGRLALEGEFDVQTLVSYGSPIEAQVPESTLSVSLRHTDDPVAALATGGSMAGTGATGSFVAERLADPAPGLHDLQIPAHGIAAYTDTAQLLDRSSDPRVDEVRGVFRELRGAASVEVIEYAAERP